MNLGAAADREAGPRSLRSVRVADPRPKLQRLELEQLVSRSLPEVFEFFSRAENLELITPPWLRFRLLTPTPVEMQAGTTIEYRLHLHGLPLRWISLIEEWEQDRRFVDRQLRGPYRLWRHEHEFIAVAGGTRMRDRVHYALPVGRLGELAGTVVVRRDLRRIFDYRAHAIAELLR
jgi:ligand-binding SRPBCC domain-containing protein